MSKRILSGAAGHVQSHFDRCEQTFCVAAVESGEFDKLSDDAWVKLCEEISKNERTNAVPVEEQRADLPAVGVRRKASGGVENTQ